MSLEIAIQNLADAINKLADTQKVLGTADLAGAVATITPITTKADPAPVPTDAKSAVAEAKAKAEAVKAQAEASKVVEEIEAKELNYQKDIQPKLIGYFKTHGKPKGMELLAKYNAKTGDGIKAADYPALLADIGG